MSSLEQAFFLIGCFLHGFVDGVLIIIFLVLVADLITHL